MNDELTEIGQNITQLLQEYEDSLPSTQAGKLSVPYGVIRSVKDILPEYSFVSDQTIRRNIVYAVEALDFFKWLINRFQTYGPVRGYQYKVGLVLIDMVLEGVTRDFLSQKKITPAKRHSRNLTKLRDTDIATELVDSMERVHTRRSNIHLHLVTDLEATKYTLRDWNDSIKCLHSAKKEFQRVQLPF